jgi:hypothetical protein
MVEIRIYVEGGGDGKNTKDRFRQGMSQFLKRLLEDSPRTRINCIVCGRRNDACRDFRNALKSHPESINILLVDSEDFVKVVSPKQHLIARDGWNLDNIDDDNIHLMVQVMESWLIADIDTLAEYYGQNFNRNVIPLTNNVEDVSKDNVESVLKRATRNTSKGEYHKIKHGPAILEKLDAFTVRRKAPSCERLYKFVKDMKAKNFKI